MIFALCSCGTRSIDEKYAADVVKKALSLPGPITAQVLKGGHSGAPLFTVNADSKKYVVRFLTHKTMANRRDEIACLNIASKEGYGPHIYFADAEQGVVIMDYLDNQKISFEQRKSDQFYIALAHFLQKIHNGPAYQQKGDILAVTKNVLARLKTLKTIAHKTVPLEKLEAIVAELSSVLLPHELIAPCHNDLHPNNMIFLGNEFRAIDYEDAAQSDPYFDIATIAVFYCIAPCYEKLLFQTYLGHEPSLQEEAKLYLVKHMALIIYAARSLNLCADYGKITVKPHKDWYEFLNEFIQEKAAGKLKAREYNLTFAKTLINHVIANVESQKFKEAIALLKRNRGMAC